MPSQTLPAAKQLLLYWQAELLKSRDSARDEECERFIEQCEAMIRALEQAVKNSQK